MDLSLPEEIVALKATVARLFERQVLPVMDGFDAIETLKTDPLTKEIPILAVTAQVMAQDRSRSIELGADGFVTKPINIESFQSEINRVIG